MNFQFMIIILKENFSDEVYLQDREDGNGNEAGGYLVVAKNMAREMRQSEFSFMNLMWKWGIANNRSQKLRDLQDEHGLKIHKLNILLNRNLFLALTVGYHMKLASWVKIDVGLWNDLVAQLSIPH